MIYITTEDEIDEHVFPSELSRIKEKLVVTHYGTGIAYDCPIEKHYFVIPSVLKKAAEGRDVRFFRHGFPNISIQ